MIQREYPHNKPEQVHGYLQDALDLVAAIDPPEELRVRCFDHAVALLSAKQVVLEQVSPNGLGIPLR